MQRRCNKTAGSQTAEGKWQQVSPSVRAGRVLYEARFPVICAPLLNPSAWFARLLSHRIAGPPLRCVQRLFVRASKDDLDLIAANLTFLTLLSIVPFFTIGLALFAAFPVFADFKSAIADYLEGGLLPEEASAAVLAHIADFSANAGQMTTAGIAVLGLTALMLMQTIESSFNRIWRVQRERSWRRRIAMYTGAVLLGPLLIGGSLAATTFLVSASLGFLPAMVWLDKLILNLFAPVMAALAFTLLFHAVPHCTVRWRHALTGGVLTAAGFELMKFLFGLYISEFPSYQMIYGAFAAVPIFLIWIYLSWIITLTGALVVALLPAGLSTQVPTQVPTEVPGNTAQPMPHNPAP